MNQQNNNPQRVSDEEAARYFAKHPPFEMGAYSTEFHRIIFTFLAGCQHKEQQLSKEQCGMRWVKASDRTSLHYETVIIRYVFSTQVLAAFYDEAIKQYRSGSNCYELQYVEWLDESSNTKEQQKDELLKDLPHIPTQEENPKGLHQRYCIQKIVPATDSFIANAKLIYDTVIPFPNPIHFGRVPFVAPETMLVPCDENAEYYVMRLDIGGSDIEHIKACRIGIHAYADAIQHYLPELSKDLKERYPLL